MRREGRGAFRATGRGFCRVQPLPPNSSPDNPRLLRRSPPCPPPFCAMSTDPQPEQSPQQRSHQLLCELLPSPPLGPKAQSQRQAVEGPPQSPPLSPDTSRPQPAPGYSSGCQPCPAGADRPCAGPWPRAAGGAGGLHTRRTGPRCGAQRGPGLLSGPGGDQDGPEHRIQPLGSTACPARSPRLRFHPTPQPGAQKAEVFGSEKHHFFSARLRTPFRENAPVKFYFPCKPPSTLPRIKTGRD